ncbi:MAG: aminotransferase [Gluconacetobacter liquefaciens]
MTSPLPSRNSLAEIDVATLIHPYTNLDAHLTSGPTIMVEGKGCRVRDDAGRWYLDAMAGLWCCSLGFDNARVAAAVHRQMLEMPSYHVFVGASNRPAIELAERMVALAPAGLDKVLFAGSGSEANDAAIKLVWYYNDARGKPEKKKIIGRDRGYHGVTIAAASATGQPANHGGFSLPLPGFLHLGSASWYHDAQPGESAEAFADRRAAELEALILHEGADTIGAMIAEPINGAGGIIVPPPGYFQKIQAVLRRHDILLIADEVICGFGRTGRMFGSEHFGITPDIMTVAKALSAAYLPISATLCSDAIFQAMAQQSRARGGFGHGVTYSAHPACAAAALEVLKIYEEMDIVSVVQRAGQHFQSRIAQLSGHPLVGQVRGMGLLGAVEPAADPKARRSFAPSEKVGPMIQARMLEQGIIVRAMRNDAIGMSPPLIIDTQDIDLIVDTLGTVLDDILPSLRTRGLVA